MDSKTYYGEYSLRHWLNLIVNRNIILPDYQRSFVWNKRDVDRLILSFKNGQFIQPVTIARMNSIGKGVNIILDGQQRLTSLLLLAIDRFPNKEKFKVAAALASDDDSAKDDEDNSPVNKNLEWTFERLLEKNPKDLDDLIHQISSSEDYESLSLGTRNCNMDSEKLDEFLDSNFLGFSFIVPDNKESDAQAKEKKVKKKNKESQEASTTTEETGIEGKEISEIVSTNEEQEFYSTLFRNMNYLGRKLSTLESRKSLYYLNEDFRNFFEGKFEAGSDALAGLKIMESVYPRSIDFVRYLSILSQFDGKNTKKIMVGYSSFSSRESYYVDYVSYILNLEQEDRIEKFNNFDFNSTFGSGVWKDRFKRLAEILNNLKGMMNLDSKHPNAFKSWIDADYWLFGLIYWVVFKGIGIDLDKEDASSLNKIIEQKKVEYPRTPNLLTNLRERIGESITFFKKRII